MNPRVPIPASAAGRNAWFQSVLHQTATNVLMTTVL